MRESIQKKLHNLSRPFVVDLQRMDIVDDEIPEITDVIISRYPDARSVFLNNNQITDKGAVLLSNRLVQLPNLTAVDLQFNQIQLAGAEALLRLKTTHPRLEIALHGNNIENVAALYQIEEKYHDCDDHMSGPKF